MMNMQGSLKTEIIRRLLIALCDYKKANKQDAV
jgi:uncharacterized protein (UPF0371 family)